MGGGFLGHSLSWIALSHYTEPDCAHRVQEVGRESSEPAGDREAPQGLPALAWLPVDPQEETVAGSSEFPGKRDWESASSLQDSCSNQTATKVPRIKGHPANVTSSSPEAVYTGTPYLPLNLLCY